MYWRDGPGFGLSENFCFFSGADAFYGENLFRCEYRWRKSLQEQRILGRLFSENPFDGKEKAHIPHGRTYTCATAPMSRPSCAGHALHDVAGLLQQALVRDPQHHTALGGEDWRVTSTISMAYSCMEEPSAVSFGSSHGSNASFRFALHENIVCRKRRFE